MPPRPNKFRLSTADNEIIFKFNPKVYHREALYGTALVFSNRCHVYLNGDNGQSLIVTLQGKTKFAAAELKYLAGEFHNELLSQTLRWMVAKHNKKTKEAIISQALLSAHGQPQKQPPQPNNRVPADIHVPNTP